MNPGHPPLVLPLALLTAVGCSAPLDFGGDTESRALTYKQYVADGGDAWFDPIG